MSTDLSAAEGEILARLLEGKSNREIAAERRRSPRTIANQVARLFRKLGVGSRGELAARARLESAAVGAGSRHAPGLSPRQRQVVAYASQGHSNKRIAFELGLATSSVSDYLATASRKLGVDSRVALIRRFHALERAQV
jgi:DNA-binding CsgD family transcriptional regulator